MKGGDIESTLRQIVHLDKLLQGSINFSKKFHEKHSSMGINTLDIEHLPDSNKPSPRDVNHGFIYQKSSDRYGDDL
jgi:hypothetical protein